jgi:tocopherol O-methyltransferase
VLFVAIPPFPACRSLKSTTLKERIRDHYDAASELYRELWGVHIHHGYWLDGTESKERAQERLIDLLAESANVANSRVLDVGCGIGGPATYLTHRFGATVTGITISVVQARIATALALANRTNSQFAVMDAEQMCLSTSYDVVFAMESISHLEDKPRFFAGAASVLEAGGRFAIVDWFKAAPLTRRDEQEFIDPIVHSMLLPELCTMADYTNLIEGCGCRIAVVRDVSANVAKTWDLCLPFIRLPRVLQFVRDHGSAFRDFLSGFKAMRAGFRSGALRYGMIVAEKL